MASFSEAVEPILKFLQFCGIHFQPVDELVGGRGTRRFLRIYAAVCLTLNIGWNGYGCVKHVPTLQLSTINDFVDYLNFYLGNVLAHVVLYCMTFGSYAQIISAIQRLERLLEHDAHYYRKLRRSSSIAVTLIVSFVTAQITMTLYRQKWNWLKTYASILGDLCLFYPMASYCLFFISALALAGSFQHVNSRLAGYLQRESKVANSLNLAEIRANHGLVCQAVDELNSRFQALSFVHVVFAFTGVVNTSFMLLTGQYFYVKIILYQMECVARLALLGYACDRIQSEALACLKTLASVGSDQITNHSLLHQQQLLMLGGQVLQTAPTFDVYGLFHLRRQLLPKLIGTTITYLVILYQFKGTPT